jgi:hypothetical protein
MNLYKETISIFQGHVTAPTREKELRRLFRTSGEVYGTPLHSVVAGILKVKLPEDETENRLKTLVGIDIQTFTPKPEVSSEAKALADEIRAELGLKPKTFPEAAEKARLARMYPSMIGPEPPAYDSLEGYSPGEREIIDFYRSGETKTFGFQDGPAPKPQDEELETMAQDLYPNMRS